MTGAGRHAADSVPAVRRGRHAAALPVDAVDGYVPSSFTAPSFFEASPGVSAALSPAAPPRSTPSRATPSRSAPEHAAHRAAPSTTAVTGSRRAQPSADRRTRQQRTAATYAVAVLGVVTTGAILLPGQQQPAGAADGILRTPTPTGTTRINTTSSGAHAGQVLGSRSPIGIPAGRSAEPVIRPTDRPTDPGSLPACTDPDTDTDTHLEPDACRDAHRIPPHHAPGTGAGADPDPDRQRDPHVRPLRGGERSVLN